MARKRTPGRTRNGTVYEYKKPWRAAVKVQYVEHFLGQFATKDEAEAQEREFRKIVFGTPDVVRKPLSERVVKRK